MKKLSVYILAALLLFTAAISGACQKGGSDLEYVKGKGKLIIGITIYEPMNFYDSENKLTGFDTEFANELCKELGVTAEFQVITWSKKEMEIKAKNIDVIWNGFTVTEDRKKDVDFSVPYLLNKQVAVTKAVNVTAYSTIDLIASAKLGAEGKSAGETAIKSDDKLKSANYTALSKQADVLLELKSGTVDVGVIDYVMAKSMIGAGTDYNDLAIIPGISLAPEEYAIGFRKGSDMAAEFNRIIAKLAGDGFFVTLAEKYQLTDELADDLK